MNARIKREVNRMHKEFTREIGEKSVSIEEDESGLMICFSRNLPKVQIEGYGTVSDQVFGTQTTVARVDPEMIGMTLEVIGEYFVWMMGATADE